MSNPPAIAEAIRLLRIIDRANMGSTWPTKKEEWIGWQYHSDEELETIRNLQRDVRAYLIAFDSI